MVMGTPYAKIHWQENITPSSHDRVLSLYDKKGTKMHVLHARTDAALWYLHTEDGRLPEALKQRWTKYSTLLQAVRKYYAGKKDRNDNPDPIEVKEE
jgi:hypothetical protein